MFKSTIRPIAIPQSEHARLAGYLAYFWGNAAIAPPPLDRAGFAMGVTHHDRGYGYFDTLAIGEVEDAIWLATQRRGIQTPLTDATADTVALLHIRRLLAHSDYAGAQALIALAEERIAETLSQTAYTRERFDQADTITRLCDRIAFNFSFEKSSEWEQAVFSRGDMLPIQVQIGEAGRVQLHPWPLAVPEVRGFILGYELSGYPDHLQPVMVEFTITPQGG